MIKLFQIENTLYSFNCLWPNTTSKHFICYVDTNSGRVVEGDELEARFGVSNFSTAKEFFEKYEKIQAQEAVEYEKDLEIEMRTSF